MVESLAGCRGSWGAPRHSLLILGKIYEYLSINAGEYTGTTPHVSMRRQGKSRFRVGERRVSPCAEQRIHDWSVDEMAHVVLHVRGEMEEASN